MIRYKRISFHHWQNIYQRYAFFRVPFPSQGCGPLEPALRTATSARLKGEKCENQQTKLFWRSYLRARLLKSIGRGGVPPCLKKGMFGLLQLLRRYKTYQQTSIANNAEILTSSTPRTIRTIQMRDRFCDSDVLSGLGRGIGIRRRSCTGKRIAEHRQTHLVQWGM